MNDGVVEVEAIIVVPDVGEYRYVGRSIGGAASSRRIADALRRITLSAEARRTPYMYGVRMYGAGGSSRCSLSNMVLRESTFRTVDRETFEGEIYGLPGCCQNDEVTRKMNSQTARKMASICDVFGCYAGVYVREWHFNRTGNGVPDAEKPYLEN